MAVVTAVAAGVAVAGAVASHQQAQKANSRKRRAARAQRAQNRLKNRQAKRAFLKNFRRAQADNYTSAILAGVGLGSSRFQGTNSSLNAQARLGVLEQDMMTNLGGVVQRFEQAAADRQMQAQNWSTVSSIASSFIGMG